MRSGPTLMKFGSYLPSGEGTMRQAEALAAGKLMAVLAGACALGLAFALYPLRAPTTTRADVLLIALALLAQGAGYAGAIFFGAHQRHRILPLLNLAALPAALLLAPSLLAQGAFAALVVLGVALELALVTGARRLLLPLAALAVPALVALGVSATAFGALIAAVLVILAPLAGAFYRAPVREAAQASEAAVSPAKAGLDLLALALRPEERMLLVTDAMGMIDDSLTPLRGEAFPDGSLTEATLIADRVALLHALADAARGVEQGQPITLRLREGHGGAGYPMPPRFEPHVLRLAPLAGFKGRVGVLVERAQPREEIAPAAPQLANGNQIARALHDGLAPFNAGMGFLEMVADPRLAPRDFTALHDFAAEAHKAMGEAHRNAVLLGLWMRLALDEGYARAKGDLGPRRLFTEVLRVMNLEEMEKRGDLVADSGFDLPVSYTMPVNAVRFALATLLRFGMGAAHVDVAFAEEGGDIVLTLTRREGGDHAAMADALQSALEEAVARSGTMSFEAVTPACRRLRLSGMAHTRRVADAIRIAS